MMQTGKKRKKQYIYHKQPQITIENKDRYELNKEAENIIKSQKKLERGEAGEEDDKVVKKVPENITGGSKALENDTI